MPQKKKWVSVNIDATVFQVPSKASKAVAIKEPAPKPVIGSSNGRSQDAIGVASQQQWPSINGSSVEQYPEQDGGVSLHHSSIDTAQPVVARPVFSSSTSSTSRRSTTPGSAHTPQQAVSEGLSSNQTTKLRSGQSLVVVQKDTPHLINPISSISPTTRSNLDIYAHKYVPYWLKAINESFAVTNHAPQIRRFDSDVYRATFTGQSMQRQVISLELPPATSTSLSSIELTPSSFQTYWHLRLQNEYAAQNAQNDTYALYGIDVTPAPRFDASMNIYQLKIPGLRESTPRIDLGDIILIRPFTPQSLHTVAEEAREWSTHRYSLAPRSAGCEYHAVVWSILRRAEIVLVRLGKPMIRDVKCNVIIPLQIHKNIPAWKATSVVYQSLYPASGSWLSSMLFPVNGVHQTTLSKGSFSLEWLDVNLNFEQKRAVQAIVDAQYGIMPYLVSGPPGTGKTKTMVETILQLLRHSSIHRPHILVCAPSDAAADTLLVRLAKYLTPHELLRLNNWTRLATEVPGEVGGYCLLDSNQLYTLPDFKTMMAFKVVVTTCRDANVLVSAGLTNGDLAYTTLRLLSAVSPALSQSINPLHWTALVLDEAAQATEPEALIPLSVIAPLEDVKPLSQMQMPQVIMAGDEYQLGPRLISRALPAGLGTFDTTGLEKSLFQRLFERPVYAEHPLSRSHGLRPLTRDMLPIIRPAFANLIRNYRSHPAILTTSSALFYSDTLIPERPETSAAILSWPHWPKRKSTWPVVFHQNSASDSVESVIEGDGSGSGTLMNVTEAEIALHHVKSLLSHVNTSTYIHVQSDHLKAEDIIVMSPFRAQVNLLRQLFRKAGFHNIRIGPVEAFQGLESRIVVLCTTRTRLGQHPHPLTKFVDEDKARNLGIIDEPKSFNVAMTRAQEALIVIGNAEVLSVSRDPCWTNFLRFCVRNELGIGQISWFGKSSSRTGITQGMGKLERALKYAESLEDLPNGQEEDESASYPTHNGAVNENQESFKFKLRGTMIDLDERMWEMYVDKEEGEEIRAQEEEDEGSGEDDEDEAEDNNEDFEGVDDFGRENTHVGELIG